MKTMIRRNTVHLLVLLVLALSVAVVATSIAPSTAQARARLENTTPLMGDPDGPDQGTQSSITKAGSVLRSGAPAIDSAGSASSISRPLAAWKMLVLVRFLLLARQI